MDQQSSQPKEPQARSFYLRALLLYCCVCCFRYFVLDRPLGWQFFLAAIFNTIVAWLSVYPLAIWLFSKAVALYRRLHKKISGQTTR